MAMHADPQPRVECFSAVFKGSSAPWLQAGDGSRYLRKSYKES
jgi:hypothetical protein